jgi:hypothetical protein
MSVLVEEVDVWEGQVPDRPGTLSDALAALSASGADLEFTVARRDTKAPGNSIVFVGPLRGEKQSAAAAKIGFRKSTTLHAVRVESPDRPGFAAEVTGAVRGAGVNINEFFGTVLKYGVAGYFWLESKADVAKVAKAIHAVK